ncbi:MAG TPA: tryptophan--tRNA ligase [Alphaproteobacteria bacterium]|nr:tryptophan--tRNA ligase [Alphaproteobacteria bacterium]
MSDKKVVLSGVKPSGQPTLGNYLGAFKPFGAFQNEHNVFFMVADQHAITVRQNPKDLAENSLAIAAWYLASRLDPARCTLFIQSQVPAHAQLSWVLNTYTQVGELERMTQYKDKGRTNKDSANAGLFTYPVLMAADILLYQAAVVPVGDDQIQHLELTRDIATRFNNLYGPVFTVPKGIKPPAAERVKDLQNPEKKMSKSEGGSGTIMLLDTPAEAAKKIKRAVTDSLGVIKYDVKAQPGLANLIEILAACTGSTPKKVAEEFAGKQYGALKEATANAVAETLEPLQKAYNGYMNDKAELLNILHKGAERARQAAAPTLAKVYAGIGFVA